MSGKMWDNTTRLERKFLRFILNREAELFDEVDIEEFMVSNFKKPNPTSPNTINSTDKGVIFLKTLKAKNLICYDDIALSHVNHWTIEGGTNGITKRWFDTLHEPLLVARLFTFYEVPLSSRLLNKRFVLKQIKYAKTLAIKYGKILLIGFWRFLVALSLVVIGVWLAMNNNLEKIYKWILGLFA